MAVDDYIQKEASAGLIKVFVILLGAALIFRFMIYPKLNDPYTHRGKNFTVAIPVGWEPYEEPYVTYGEDVEVFVMAPSELVHPDKEFKYMVDDSRPVIPSTMIKIYSKHLELPIWLEAEFPEIVGQLVAMGRVPVDKGQLMFGEHEAKWILTESPDRQHLWLEFYVIGQGNKFIKMEFATIPSQFATYRPVFDHLKDTIKF